VSALAMRARRAVREVCALAPTLGLLPPPSRPAGIAAIIRVRDEDEWLEPAVRSIIGFADHVVIGDNGSTDRTPAIMQALAREFPEVVETLTLPDVDICRLTNALIERTRHRFIVRWDADFVAQTSGPARIARLRDWLLALDERRYYIVYPRMVEVTGDLWHQDPTHPTRGDAHCWTASDDVRYVYDPEGYEAPKVPKWYAMRGWDEPCFYHVNVKSDRRMFLSHLWKRYLLDRTRPADLQSYVDRVLKTEFDGQDFGAAAHAWTQGWVRRLVPFDATRYPAHPELLRPVLGRPRYRLRVEGGRVVGRETLEGAR